MHSRTYKLKICSVMVFAAMLVSAAFVVSLADEGGYENGSGVEAGDGFDSLMHAVSQVQQSSIEGNYSVIWFSNGGLWQGSANPFVQTAAVSSDDVNLFPETDPTRGWHNLIGWQVTWAQPGGEPIMGQMVGPADTFSELSDGNHYVTIWAVWEPKEYTVAWNAGSSAAVWPDGQATSTTVIWNDSVLPAENPTRNGFALVEWRVLAGGFTLGPVVTADCVYSDLVAHDGVPSIMLIAQWLPLYTVTFDSAGGSDVASAIVVSGETVAKPVDPVLEWYNLSGWYLNGYAFDFNTPIVGDITLVADWTAKTYTVAWNAGSSAAVWPAGQATSATVTYADTVLPAENPARDGFILSEWRLLGPAFTLGPAVTADCVYSDLVAHDGVPSIMLIAQWLPLHTVTFDSAGGSDVASVTVVGGSAVEKPADPTKTWYDFMGWYLGGEAFDFDALIVGDITLVADWTAKTYTVAWNAGSSAAVWPAGQATSATVTYADTVLPAENPARDGFILSEWRLLGPAFTLGPAVTADCVYSDLVAHDGVPSIMLIAQWLPLYTVTFDSAGGSDVASAIVVSGETVAKPVDPVLMWYNLTGWYLNGEAFDFSTPIVGDITLVADWTAREYTVTWNAGSAEAVWPAGQETSGKVIWSDSVLPALNPTRDGFAVVGWNMNFSGVLPLVNIPVSADCMFADLAAHDGVSAIMLVAQWLPLYTVTFDSNGGSAVASALVVSGETVAKPVDPVLTWYNLTGWYLNGEAFDFSTPIVGDITLVADWTAREYLVTWNATQRDAVWPAGQETSATVIWSDFVLPAQNPTLEGFVFAGWQLNFNGLSLLNGVMVTSDHIFADLAANDSVSAIMMFAHWTPLYTVTFDSAGGSDVASVTVVSGETVAKPADPAKAWYNFSGWYLDGVAFDFSTPIVGDITLVADWTAREYTVTWNAGSAEAVWPAGQGTSTTAIWSDSVLPALNPTRDGFAVVGWNMNFSGVLPLVNIPVSADCMFADLAAHDGVSAIMLVAQWLPLYTVTFDSNGGSAVASALVVSGETVAKPADPAKAWYNFSGWYLNGEAFDFSTPIVGDITLVADWTAREYTVTWNAGSAAAEWPAGQETSGKVIWSDSVLPAQNPTLAGFVLAGWNLVYNGELPLVDVQVTADCIFANLAANADITAIMLVAQWTPLYTVTFDSAGGSDVASAMVVSGETVAKPADPAKAWYNFSGWYLDGVAFDFSTPIVGDITLVADWTAREYTVTWNAGSAEAVWPAGQGTSTTAIWSDSVLPAQNPTLTGYVLTGWDLVYNGELPLVSIPVTADCIFADLAANADISAIMLVAQWELARYVVAWNAGPSDADWPVGSVKAKDVYWEAANLLPAVEPVRDGHILVGWRLANDGANEISNGQIISASDKFSELAAHDGVVSITLIAVWAEERFVTFVSEGDVFDTQIVAHGGLAKAPDVNPVKYGYNFVNWLLGDAVFDFNTPVTANITLVADWTVSTYTVVFVDWNGDVLNTQVVDHGSAAVAPENPVRTGYTFTGWNAEFDYIASDLMVTALYTINTYTVTFDSAGGSEVASASVDFGYTAEKPEDPVREGQYNFVGWFFDGAAFDFDTPIVGDITLVAGWERWYTVGWIAGADADWNGEETSMRVSWNDANLLPAQNPTIAGQTLVAWELRSTGAGLPIAGPVVTFDCIFSDLAANDGVSGILLVAVWESNEYTVTWNAGSAEAVWPAGQATSTTAAWNDTVLPIQDPTRVGYTLIGWNLVYNGTLPLVNIPVSATDTFGDLAAHDGVSAIMLVAQWEINTYEVVFYSLGEVHEVQILTHGQTAEMPSDPVNPGYTFAGWMLDGEIFDLNTPITGGMDLVASWESKMYTVTWHAYPGELGGGSGMVAAWNDSGLIPDADPTRAGYDFTGWALAWNGLTAVEGGVVDIYTLFSALAADDSVIGIILEAQWEVIVYTATFISGQETHVVYGSAESPVYAPPLYRPGHSLVWLYQGGDTVIAFPYAIKSDVTFEAHWVLLKFTVEFIYDGELVSSVVTDVASYVNAPDMGSMPGYELVWLNEEGDAVAFPFTVSGYGNVVLTGEWKLLNYVVAFYSAGGSDVESVFVYHGYTVERPADPVREGYDFVGWYLDGVAFDFGTVIIGHKELVAEWTVKTYTVTFVGFDGETLASETVDHGSAATAPEAPYVTGHTFAGWSAEFDNVTSDLTVTALYTINTYTVTFLDRDGGLITEVTVNHGSDAVAPAAPVITGYMFTGWNGVIVNITEDVTVTATYVTATYTISGQVFKVLGIINGEGDIQTEALEGVEIMFTLNGVQDIVFTNADGGFTIIVAHNTDVVFVIISFEDLIMIEEELFPMTSTFAGVTESMTEINFYLFDETDPPVLAGLPDDDGNGGLPLMLILAAVIVAALVIGAFVLFRMRA